MQILGTKHATHPIAAAASLALLAMIAGCSGRTDKQVELNQFSNNIDTSAGASAPRVVYAPIASQRSETETLVIRPLETAEQVGTPASDSDQSERFVAAVYDAKIGDINGRPIIASRFLEDLMPRLQALASEADMRRNSWRREAGQIIARKLDGMIRDEVLYREGRSKIPQSSQQGLFHFAEQVRQQVIRQAGGSETLAEQGLLEQENQTMDEFLESISRQRVIKGLLDEVAEDYAPVSWLDIQNEYQRRYDYFNPDPVVFFRIITTPDAATAQLVKARLESGESFAELAIDNTVNIFAPDRGGMLSEDGTSIDVPLADAVLINDPILNAAIVALSEDEWAGPLDRAEGRKSYVYLERIVQTSASIDEEHIQLAIERFLKQQRSEEALNRFVNDLKERANLGPERFNELVLKVLAVAETRVFGPQSPGV